jgi:hypothetical protein
MTEPEGADIRPTLLGVVTLLFLLLFFLLSTSTGQRLAALDLRFASEAELAPLPHTGLVDGVRVAVRPSGAVVTFEVQTTDIAAASSAVEQRRIDVAAGDLVALASALETVKAIDPAQERARLALDDAMPVSELMPVLDVVRAPYPKVTLE